MNKQKSILIFIDWFTPAFKAGGPIQSISNFVKRNSQDYAISIVTSDRDLGDLVSFEGVPLNQWLQKDGFNIIYLDKAHQTTAQYKDIFNSKEYDAAYFNSFFSVPFTLKPLIASKKTGAKIVLAPRGMLGAGALQIKPLKKKLFIVLSKIFGLYKGITWQATAETEKAEIIKHFGKKAIIKVAPNLPSVRLRYNITRGKESHEVSLFFVSRIAKKKNLLEALKMLEQVSATKKIVFHVIGPVDEVDYWNECKTVIEQLPVHIKVVYEGSIPNHELASRLSGYHFLFLPTLHENYGHAIIESFQCGCPVIISDRTPWRNLEEVVSSKYQVANTKIEDVTKTGDGTGVGWDISLEHPERFVEVIEYCAAMGQEEYNAMSQRAFEYARKVTEDPEVLEANRRLFS